MRLSDALAKLSFRPINGARPAVGLGVLIIAALSAPAAMADVMTNYTINFTGTGILPTAGSFTYDSTTPQFSDFMVVWDGLTFDLTSAANAPNFEAGSPLPACVGGTADAEASFDLLSGDCKNPPAGYEVSWAAGSIFDFRIGNDNPPFDSLVVEKAAPSRNGSDFGDGSWTITAVVPSAVPEPSSVMLLATLCALAFRARKRIAVIH